MGRNRIGIFGPLFALTLILGCDGESVPRPTTTGVPAEVAPAPGPTARRPARKGAKRESIPVPLSPTGYID